MRTAILAAAMIPTVAASDGLEMDPATFVKTTALVSDIETMFGEVFEGMQCTSVVGIMTGDSSDNRVMLISYIRGRTHRHELGDHPVSVVFGLCARNQDASLNDIIQNLATVEVD